jgi:hypothetical protein
MPPSVPIEAVALAALTLADEILALLESKSLITKAEANSVLERAAVRHLQKASKTSINAEAARLLREHKR